MVITCAAAAINGHSSTQPRARCTWWAWLVPLHLYSWLVISGLRADYIKHWWGESSTFFNQPSVLFSSAFFFPHSSRLKLRCPGLFLARGNTDRANVNADIHINLLEMRRRRSVHWLVRKDVINAVAWLCYTWRRHGAFYAHLLSRPLTITKGRREKLTIPFWKGCKRKTQIISWTIKGKKCRVNAKTINALLFFTDCFWSIFFQLRRRTVTEPCGDLNIAF